MKALVLAVSLLSAGAAVAAEKPRSAEAILVAAPERGSETVIDGRLWRCLGTGCRGLVAGPVASQPPGRECRRVAARLGELAHYRTGKRVFTAAELARCNTAAVRRPSATELAGSR